MLVKFKYHFKHDIMRTFLSYFLLIFFVLIVFLVPLIAMYLAGVYHFNTWNWIPLVEPKDIDGILVMCILFVLFEAFIFSKVTHDDRREK